MVVWANHRVWEEPPGLSAVGHGCMGATSRVRREAYARFCERQGVRLPLPTRRLETEVRPDEATFSQRVKFPPRQGPASQRESSLAPREVTTAAKRRQSDRQAVTKVK